MVKSITRAAIDRRKLLVGTSSVLAAGILTRAASIDALAQEKAQGRLFLNSKQAAEVEAIAEIMWPTTEDSAGGRDAGVMNYIDRALAGPYSDYQDVYVAGLEWLDFASISTHGSGFAALTEEQQLDIVTQVFEGDLGEITSADVSRSGHTIIASSGSQQNTESATPTSESATPVVASAPANTTAVSSVDGMMVAGIAPTQASNLLAFMNIVRVHVMEGLFSDPAHGGNRDFAGWAAVGYPGPYVLFTEEQQQSFEPLNLPFQSIADF